MEIIMKPIGYIESPFKDPSEIPRQTIYAKDKIGKLKLEDKYIDGLYGLKVGDFIELFFYFHQSKKEPPLKFIHHLSNKERGVFSTRSPHRPNAIGKSIVEIIAVDHGTISFKGVDMLDGTPVLDIKPYVESLNPD